MKSKHNHDIVGKPDKDSNLRLIKFYKPKNESRIEQKYRLEREKVQQWNQEFWSEHNRQFVNEKQNFQKMNIKENDPLASDKMSVFYKQFLDKNWKSHFNYNMEWYRKNAFLVFLALGVKASRLMKMLKSQYKR